MDWMLEDGQVICVTGSIPQLGMWQPDQMLLLTGGDHGAVKCVGLGRPQCKVKDALSIRRSSSAYACNLLTFDQLGAVSTQLMGAGLC
jgi:hypothetical protein